jgi:hypothetical protein
MVHSNYKHFEGCYCPTIAGRIPPKLTVLIQPRQPSIADWQDLVRAGATWNDKPRNAPPQYRIVSYA